MATKSVNICCFPQVRALNSKALELACEIGVHDANGSIADAKSLLGLISLDYNQPVEIVVDDDYASVLQILLHAISEESKDNQKSIFNKLNSSFKK